VEENKLDAFINQYDLTKTAIHEVIVRDVNFLAIDIDEAKEMNNYSTIAAAVCNHPIV
jgi:hypothetical protein